MDQLKFDCPPLLAKKFWSVCVSRDETVGETLRSLMIKEIVMIDPEFREKIDEILNRPEDSSKP